MGYKIEYGRVNKLRRMERRRSAALMLAGICLIAVLFFGTYIRESITDEPWVTVAALDGAANKLRQGMGLREAMLEFCCRILEG